MSDKLDKSKRVAGLFAILITVFIAIIVTAMPAIGKTLDETNEPLAVSAAALSCRFGTTAWNSAQGEKLAELGAGWYLNFGPNAVATVPSNIEFVPMVRLSQDKIGDDIYLDSYSVSPPLTDAGLGAKIDASPGATWVIGNEPDRGPAGGGTGQDDMMPDMYARALHDVAEYIKDRDPTAKTASAGLVQITPGRIQYWDMVADAYYAAYKEPLPVDVWTMHIYVMPEVRPDGSINNLASVAVGTDPALGMKESGGAANLCGNVNNDVYCFADHDNIDFFKRQIKDMRIWMKAQGQQNKPLLITEYSILYPYETEPDGSCEFLQDEYGNCFTPARVSNYLRNTFDLIDGVSELKDVNLGYPQDENRLVQQVMWWSLNAEHYPGSVSNLYNDDLTALTVVGSAFKSEVADRTLLPNLFPDNAAHVSGFIIAPATTATVTLSVDVYNNGNTAVTAPTTVTFYNNAALTPVNEIGSISMSNLDGCARGPVTVSVPWSGLISGVHRYWVKVDNGNVVNESNENDNIASGLVIIDPYQNFLPSILR